MTETNMGFANSGSDDDIDGLEFRVDGDDAPEHDLSELRQEYDDVMSSDTSEEEGNDEEPEEYDEGPAEYEPTEINQAIASPVQNSDTIIIAKSKVVLIEKLLQNIRENNDK
ncbi:MAG: hypothetical protein Q7T50_06080, partial [Candidatus Magasanikbacteria bacterium]|nr:hypothetical protein [Candidatus Magasanikbacteria bacterium]